MIAIGHYLLLIISLAGITLSVDSRFSDRDIANFLLYIFRLHVGVRIKHNASTLHQTDEMDAEASKILHNDFESNNSYGIAHNSMQYDDNTQLDGDEAKKFFSIWYEQGSFYDYNHEPSDYSAVAEFTQILWTESFLIGLAFSYESDRYVVLAIYDPPGNVRGQYTTNVQRPLMNRHAWDPVNINLIYQTETEKFIDNILILHNYARVLHGVDQLKHDVDMDSEAYSMLKNGQKTHPSFGVNFYESEIDENIILHSKELATALFSKWYGKVQEYDSYNSEPLSNNADSFTQIVWSNTKKAGVSYIKNNDGRYQFMVLYEPPGNIPGEFASNVFVPRSLDLGSSGDN